jgi:CHAT domain-containing protein
MNGDKQQVEAYINLIQQLLGCEDGTENAILQQHTELVDAGLVGVMKQYVGWMESQGDTNAGRLRQLAGHLAQMLGQAGVAQNVGQDTVRFAMEMMQLIAQTQGDRSQIYPFFQANLTCLNSELLAVLPIVFRNALAIDQLGIKELVALAYADFGSLIQQFLLGNRMLNLELCIAAYQLVLQVYTREAFPEQWAWTQNNLATAYSDRIRGERADNLELAIAAYQLALQVYTREAFPADWAWTQNSLAAAYSNRIRGERADNLELAITAYQLTLQVYTREAFPEDWARAQNNLAIAYSDRIRGEKADNLELAITAYQLALQVRTREVFPEQWARTQNNLAAAYSNRVRGERADNLELAITAYQLTLQVYTREAFPEDWAWTQNSLAAAYSNRIRGERADNLELAITADQLALQVFTRESFPEDWARAQNNLAIAYSDRIRGERADNLELAITAYQLALQVRTREVFPQNWAATQNRLAVAYISRIRGERADNLELAIATFQLSLQVRTREAFPEDWAATQNNLAAAYRSRIRGERADNLELAIATYQLALQVFTHEAFPEQWAATQNNLAVAYTSRIRGERADNFELGIAALQLALQVFTHEAFPEQWAKTQNNLAVAYTSRIRGERDDNLKLAITALQLTLQVFTREASPQDWATTQNNLAAAYSNRIRGERADNADNFELGIAALQLALQVFTREAFPEQWAKTQNNLAAAYNNRIQGEKANNLELAIAAYQLALQVYTREALPENWAETQNNLAVAYTSRIRGERADNLELAITAYQLSLQIRTREAFPKECRMTSRSLGNLHFEQQTWNAAATAYDTALEAAEILYQSCIFLEGQAAELSETDDLHHRVTYAHAKNNNLPAALLTLELGRARGLSDSLARDRANLDQLKTISPDLFAQYQTLTQEIRNLEIQQRNPDTNHSDQLRQALTQTRQALTETIATIQQVEGYQTFLKPPTFDDITRALTAEQAIVYFTATSAGSLALILTPNTEIHPVWLNELNQEQMRKLIIEWFSAYSKQQRDRQTWYNAIDQTTQILWDKVMGAVVQKLTELHLPQAVLIPTGYLGLLPLHAAWTADNTTPIGKRYALDTIHFTYAPNARSLREARELGDRTLATSLLAIDEPKHRYEDPENPRTYRAVSKLPNSSREIEAAIATFQTPQVLRHEQATRSAVLAQLPHINVLHCSCHGNADLQEPLKSGLALTGDGESAVLTLRDILDLKLAESTNGGIRLAILSACETGLSGIEAIDEVISLPTGLLQAGVAGVAASLWSVSELSTYLLLTQFYELWRTQHLPADQALRQAQIWLRDSTEKEIAPLLGLRTRTPEQRPFSHPFHWSAFTYTGV